MAIDLYNRKENHNQIKPDQEGIPVEIRLPYGDFAAMAIIFTLLGDKYRITEPVTEEKPNISICEQLEFQNDPQFAEANYQKLIAELKEKDPIKGFKTTIRGFLAKR